MGIEPLNSPLKIALTGGIGSGKTTVTDLFADLSVPIIDADRISRELEKKGQPVYEKIINLFGDNVLDESGELRRKYLRGLVFGNPELKKQLESIVHPAVRESIKEHVSNIRAPYCIISIPLLFESGLQNTVDRILVVDAPEEQQIDRASKRDDVQPDDIRKIIRNQIDRDTRLHQADDIIVNDRDVKHLKLQVERLHRKYMDQTREKTPVKS